MDRAGLVAALAGAVLVFGCDNSDSTGPDAGDGGVSNMVPDAGDEDVSAVEFEFRTAPQIPKDDLGEPWNASLSKATFRILHLRVVGDAAILEQPEFEMEFTERDHLFLEFSPAAPGIYSTLIGRIDHVQIEGTVDIGAGDQEFRIDDAPPVSTTFVVALGNASVAPGETTKLRVDIGLDDVINEIDWGNADFDDDKLVPDENEAEKIREQLTKAFELN